MNRLYIFTVGAVMGLAEVVPGVSGGTIAFVGGIFERLITAIKSINRSALSDLFRGRFRAFSEKTDFLFLVVILIGMGLGIVIGVFGITYLLEHHPIGIWSFFFGLILASAVYLGSKIKFENLKLVLGIVLGAAVAFWITILSPATGKDAYWAYFLSGMIAISAMILPGISGSFILLLLGMYPLVLGSAKGFLSEFDGADLSKIIVFGLGCVIGILGFSRVLSWLFSRYQMMTYAVLTGFIFGSLNKIWPWKRPMSGQTESGEIVDLRNMTFEPGEMKIIREENLSPFHQSIPESHLGLAIIACVLGILVIYLLSRVEGKFTAPEENSISREF